MNDKLIERLKTLAKKETSYDKWGEFDVNDVYGGNFDDAYSGGFDSGEIALARSILIELGISYE